MSHNPAAIKIEGYFLTFTKEEEEAIREAFDEYGIEMNPQGLKDFILDAIQLDAIEEEKPGAVDSLINTVAQAVKKNPDTVRAYAAIAGDMFVKAMTKKAAPR